VTANGPCGTEGQTCEDADDGDDSKELDQGERVMGTIFVLVERGRSGCSHSDDLNFGWQISKGKKQLVHIGGVAGGDLDHWAFGGVGLAGDQWCDQGGQEGGGSGDGGIDQDSDQCLLCRILGIPREQWHNGFNVFDHHEHAEYGWGKFSWDCFFGSAAKVYQFRWIGDPQRISFRGKTDQLFGFDRYAGRRLCESEFGL